MKYLSIGIIPTLLLANAIFLYGAPASPASAHQDNPEDPNARVSDTEYRSVIRGYKPSKIILKPLGWRELNDRAEKIGGPRGQLRGLNEPIRKKKKR